ncbi:MAG: FAD-dependent oxidoreductase [Pseudomonadota bacterium]
MAEPRIVVVGAGIVGSAIAYRLARQGCSVTVIDASGPGSGATAGSFAWINAHDASDAGYFEMRMRSIKAWRGLANEVPDLAVSFCGCMDWEVPATAMIDQVASHKALGHDVRVMGKGEIEDLVPAIAAPGAAIWSPDDGAVDPDKIAQQLLAAACTAGADLKSGKVIGLGDGGREITLEGAAVIAADHCVIAAGLGSVNLIRTLGLDLPLGASPGLIVRTDPLPGLLKSVLTTPDVHVWQLSDGRLVAGSDYGGTFSPESAEDTIAGIHKALRALLPDVNEIKITDKRITNRPMPADGRPILGPVPGYGHLSIAVMHSGVTLAPVVAQLITESIVDGTNDGFEAYRLDRFIN